MHQAAYVQTTEYPQQQGPRLVVDRRIKGALLDVDEVLINSEQMHYLGNAVYFAKFGVKLTREDNKGYWIKENGRGTQGVIDDYELDKKFGLTAEIARRERENAFDSFRRMCLKPIRGAADFLEFLRTRQMPMVAVTSNYRRSTEANLRHCRMFGYFRGIIDYEYLKDNGLDGKPAPDPYIAAAKMIGVSPENCIGVEDSRKGAKSMRKAGVGLKIVCPCEWTKDEDFTGEAEPDFIVASLEEIIMLNLL